jgi:hypothetical protein
MRIVCWNCQGDASRLTPKQFRQIFELAGADVGILLEPPATDWFKDRTEGRRSSRIQSGAPPPSGLPIPEPEEWTFQVFPLLTADQSERIFCFSRPDVVVQKTDDHLDKAIVLQISGAVSITIAFTHIPYTTADPPSFLRLLQSQLFDRGVPVLMGDVNVYGVEEEKEEKKERRASTRGASSPWEVKLQSKTGKKDDRRGLHPTLDRVYCNSFLVNVRIERCGRIYPASRATEVGPLSAADQERENEDLKLDFGEISQGYCKPNHWAIYADFCHAKSSTDGDQALRKLKRTLAELEDEREEKDQEEEKDEQEEKDETRPAKRRRKY